MYDRQRPVAPALNVLEVELPTVPKGPVYDRERSLPFDRQETHIATVHSDPLVLKAPEERSVWRLDSDTETNLDRIQKRPSPELDLTIHPRLRRQPAVRILTDPNTTRSVAPTENQKADEDRPVRSDRKYEGADKTESKSCKTNQRKQGPDNHPYRRSLLMTMVAAMGLTMIVLVVRTKLRLERNISESSFGSLMEQNPGNPGGLIFRIAAHTISSRNVIN